MIFESRNLDEPVDQGQKRGPLVRSAGGLENGFAEFEGVVERLEERGEVFVDLGGREVEAGEEEMEGLDDLLGGG